jgi:hypothetical protein
MNLALWIVTGLLAASYLTYGVGKMVMPKVVYSAKAPWSEDFSAGSIKTIGALEVMAAVGLIVPAVFDFAPMLVPLAALGLVVIMVGAVITRIVVRQLGVIYVAADVTYIVLAGFVAWGRFGPEAFA